MAIVGQCQAPLRGIQGYRGDIQDAFDIGLPVEILGFDQQAFPGQCAGEEGLGQGRALVGQERLAADQHQTSGKALLSQAQYRLGAGLASPQDEQGLGHPRISFRR